ncbi:alpha/beta hydrolase [Microbacterium sp. RU33B]|uniref:alpha/beta hydrolase n=1 Tax=Microbacterium sp. RU33B TaxID=1907390 RepID=UPI0009762921|nr:alpha/beta hydrolase fold domain-containing protein [Microbacterium sp. RU33B]
MTTRTLDLPGSVFEQKARLFEPVGVPGPRPTVFWIHGGGLVSGTPTVDDRTNIALAHDLGATVIAPSYRLAPEHRAPAALDCGVGRSLAVFCYRSVSQQIWSVVAAAPFASCPSAQDRQHRYRFGRFANIMRGQAPETAPHDCATRYRSAAWNVGMPRGR